MNSPNITQRIHAKAYPDKVYKPSKGLFRLVKFERAETDTP
jgi:hypothetical protein